MQINETKNEGLKREFEITIPSSAIEENVSSRLQQLAKTIKLPGFRPGKVPVNLLRKKYGSSVMGEVLETTLNEASQKVMTERSLRPARQPDIKIIKFDEGCDLEYKMSLEVLPEIIKLDASTIKLERLVAAPDEARVEEIIERLAAVQKTSQTVTSRRKAKSGDVVIIDFLGKVDGEAFPGGQADAYSLELGSGSFIPGFEDQLIGAKAGDHVDVKVAFPKEYGAAELAGKDAVFEVDVKELRQTVPAAVDDELAKSLGLDNLDSLKSNIRDEQCKELSDQSRSRLKRSLLDNLAAKYDFEVPTTLVDAEFEYIWKQFEENRQEDPEKFKDEDKSDDEYKDEFRIISERRIRLSLLLSDVAEANNIHVHNEEINKAVREQANRHQGHEQEVIEYFQKTQGAKEGIGASIKEDKVVDFIIEMADVSEKKVSVEELMKEPDDVVLSKAKLKAKPKPKSKPKPKPKAKKAAVAKKAVKKDK